MFVFIRLSLFAFSSLFFFFKLNKTCLKILKSGKEDSHSESDKEGIERSGWCIPEQGE